MAKTITTTMKNVRGLVRKATDRPGVDEDDPGACADEASGLFPPGVFAWVNERDTIVSGRNTATLVFKFMPRRLNLNIGVGNDGIVATTRGRVLQTPRPVSDLVDDVLAGELGWQRMRIDTWWRGGVSAFVRIANKHEHVAPVPGELCFVIEFENEG